MNQTPLEGWIQRKVAPGTDRLTLETLRHYQLDRLRETIAYARAQSPFYRTHLSKTILNISGLADMARIPFTTAAHIRNNPLSFLCVSQSQIEHAVTLGSSGTTGTPKRLFFTRQDILQTIDFFCIGMSTFTTPEDRVLILLPGERTDSVGDLLQQGLAMLGATGIKHGPVTDPHATLRMMRQQHITGLVGIPTQVLWLAKTWAAAGLPPLMVKNVLLSTDYVPMALAQRVELLWNCKVYHHYGMTEMGLGGGIDCQAFRGYHLRETDLFFEIIDPQTLQPVPDGVTGEVVFTTLDRSGMPLIRYRTGDKASFLPERCPCGTVLRTMSHVQGRIAGQISLGINQLLTLPQLDEVLFSFDEIINYQATLQKDAGIRKLSISIYTEKEPSSALTDKVKSAVCSLPAITEAVRNGGLKINPITVSEKNWIMNGMTKRVLFQQPGPV